MWPAGTPQLYEEVHVNLQLTCIMTLTALCATAMAEQAVWRLDPPVPTAAQTPQFSPRHSMDTVRHGNVRLTSVLQEGADLFPGTTFTVLREEAAVYGRPRYTVMATSGPHAEAIFSLHPGPYLVRVHNGSVDREERVEVPAQGMLNHQIALEAGELQLSGVMSHNGPAATETWFRVLRDETDAYGRPIRVQVAGNGYADSAGFVLPAGDYIAEATFGNAMLDLPVKIKAGAVTRHEMVLRAARLELFSTFSDQGARADGTRFRVYRTPSTPGQTEQPALMTQAQPTDQVAFVLPAGEYRATAQLDHALVDIPVTLQAGETRTLEMPLNAGEVTLLAALSGEQDPLINAWFDIQPEGPAAATPGPDETPTHGPDHKARFIVPAGRYRASARVGESTGSVMLDVEAGDSLTTVVNVDAGRVSLSLLDQADTPRPDAFTWYSVYRVEHDANGKLRRRRVFNDGYYAQTELVLPAGTYIAFARNQSHQGEREFTLQAGEIKSLSIVAGN